MHVLPDSSTDGITDTPSNSISYPGTISSTNISTFVWGLQRSV